MKCLVKSFLFSFICFYKIGTIKAISDCEGINDNEGDWICIKNYDGTYNLTYDCSLNDKKVIPICFKKFFKTPNDISGSFQIAPFYKNFPTFFKDCTVLSLRSSVYSTTNFCCNSSFLRFDIFFQAFELKLWTSQFPKTIRSLKIQNCEELTLDSNCTSEEEPIKTFNYLHVLNITNFTIVGREKEITGDYYHHEVDRLKEIVIVRKFGIAVNSSLSTVRLPENVIFENIGIADFKTPLISNHLVKCGYKTGEFKFESFQMKNVTIEKLGTYFIWEYNNDSANMKEFVMDNVNIGSISSRAIYLYNDKAKLEISNSNFSHISGTFADFDVSKVSLKF